MSGKERDRVEHLLALQRFNGVRPAGNGYARPNWVVKSPVKLNHYRAPSVPPKKVIRES